MKDRNFVSVIALALALGAVGLGASDPVDAQQAVALDADDIGGIVTGPRGPEAGVWVIAETRDLPTRFIRIVVTDDQGRFVVPDLPRGTYDVWVRGYGLVDSPKQRVEPGRQVSLTAVPAPDARAAAQYYPAAYWYAMLDIPDPSAFPIKDGPRTQTEFLNTAKTNGCVTCHAMGNEATRLIPAALGPQDSMRDAWQRRIQSGQAGSNMVNAIGRLGTNAALTMYGDWSARIHAGALPFAQPERPKGAERNLVITQWDWADEKSYLHDSIATDRRKPTVNSWGKLYGAQELSADRMPILDPRTHTATMVTTPVRDKNTPTAANDPMFAPSPYWGEEVIWDSQANIHNPMLDEKGQVWLTHRIRPNQTSAFCRQGSNHPSAKVFPIQQSNRQLSVYDPATNKFTLIDTCFGTHHLQFDEKNVLWTSGGGPVLGWFDRNVFEQTGDEQKAQGWTPFIVDTNGNGKRDEYVEPNQPVDPTKDKRVAVAFYAVAPNPADGSIWGTSLGGPGYLVRVVPGADPSTTALTEIFEVPTEGAGIRGGDIDSDGVFWAGLTGGQFASFDRRKCRGPLNGPAAATGKHCPEGWTLHRFPGPQFANVRANGSVESSYYTWVDQHDTLGLGKNIPIATGNLNESLIALKDGQMINMVVPYPLGFYAKGLDGRIDDPNGGWKARGLWTTYGNRTPFHNEGGTINKPKVVQFQLRPDPLAK